MNAIRTNHSGFKEANLSQEEITTIPLLTTKEAERLESKFMLNIGIKVLATRASTIMKKRTDVDRLETILTAITTTEIILGNNADQIILQNYMAGEFLCAVLSSSDGGIRTLTQTEAAEFMQDKTFNIFRFSDDQSGKSDKHTQETEALLSILQILKTAEARRH